jgi:hypothetical protein
MIGSSVIDEAEELHFINYRRSKSYSLLRELRVFAAV